MNRRRLLRRLQSGSLNNVALSDFEDLLRGLGYSLDRTRGSHRFYEHPDVPDIMNIQPDHSGQAKRYQLRDLLDAVERYNLKLED